MSMIILPVSADAAKIVTTGGNTGTISIVGLVTTEKVAVQIPRVAAPDGANDDHWTALKQNAAATELTVDHNVVRIPANLLLRLVKDAGAAGNAYGVRIS